MITEDYDDTKILRFLFNFFHFFDCNNQTSVTSVKTRYLDSVKSILKQMQCRLWFFKKAKNNKWRVL